jgi:aprataxin
MNSPPEKQQLDDSQEAITAEEIEGTAEPGNSCSKAPSNACNSPFFPIPEYYSNSPPVTELMTSAKKASKGPPKSTPPARPAAKKTYSDFVRDGLGTYIQHPERHPQEVVEYDDEFVVVRDRYPKASVHLLILPRDKAVMRQHPLEALSKNLALLEKAKARVECVKKMAASELRRQFGRDSESDKPYQEALEELMSSSPDPPPPEERDSLLPPGRDWSKEIIAGVHTHPSMNHLHIHVLSRDMHGPSLKKKKHYLSFNTTFLVGLDEFPLEEGSQRFHPGDWPSWDLVCWRCGQNFRNQFAKLQAHLEVEFESWKRE